MATASYQTYMRCQMRQPPLEFQWALQAVSVPSGGLGLSLQGSSIQESRITSSQNPSQVVEAKPFISNGKGEQDKLNCCPECTSSFEKEAQLIRSTHDKNLPPWLQPQGTNANQKDHQLIEMRRKWNGICEGLNHQGRSMYSNHGGESLNGRSNAYCSSYPWWPTQSNTSNSISFTESALMPNYYACKFRRQKSFNFCIAAQKQQTNLGSLKSTHGVTLALGSSFFTGSGKWEKGRSDLSKLLQENVPWQSKTIDSIVKVVAESKSSPKGIWLLIQGNDRMGKRRLALAIAESILGSADLLLYLNARNKTEDESLTRALRNGEKLVALVEDVDFADTQFLKFLGDGYETGKFGETEITSQIIFILTMGGELRSYEDCVIPMKLEVKELRSGGNLGKRKADEWEVLGNEEEEEHGNGNKRQRQSSFNTLDLNMKADEEEDYENGIWRAHGFVELIKDKFVFDRNEEMREIREGVYWKMYKGFEEIFGEENRNIGFSIEKKVIEEMIDRYGSFINSKLERWVKDIFQTSLDTVKSGGKRGLDLELRLCFQGSNGIVSENGYMGSSLPKNINVSFIMD